MLEFIEKVRIRFDHPFFFCVMLTYLSAGQETRFLLFP